MTDSDEGVGSMVAVVAAGLLVLLMLMCAPMDVRVPGDHESVSCSLTPAFTPRQSPGDPRRTWETVRDRCATERNKRFVVAGMVVLATAAGTALVARHYRRRRRLRP